MEITILQLHKRSSNSFENIQDKFAFSEANRCFALADGTTQSFKSEIWAEIITANFVENPTFEDEKLISDFTNCAQKYKDIKFEFSKKYPIASLEKTKWLSGGTATFLGLQFLEDNQLRVISCGDSNLFIKRKKNIVESFPYTTLDSLSENNFFLNTEKLIQGKVDTTFFQSNSFTFQNGDIILLATDALSRLLLKNPNVIDELIETNNFETFLSFCLNYWEKKEMEEDDISAIVININIENKYEIKTILPPKEQEKEFMPLADPNTTTTSNPHPINMDTIEKQQLDGVINEFYQVKKKVKTYEMLLIILFGISCINLVNYMNSTTSSNIEELLKNIDDRTSELDKRIEKLEKTRQTFINQPTSPPNNSENEIMRKQQELKNAGYDISVDGIWGAKSEKAWNEYLKIKNR